MAQHILNTRGFQALYRNIRYWLRNQCNRRAITKEEKFIHAHAQLRNVIERSYGILKARFPLFDKIVPYPINIQKGVVIAFLIVNYFIRKEHINDNLFHQVDTPLVIFDEKDNKKKHWRKQMELAGQQKMILR